MKDKTTESAFPGTMFGTGLTKRELIAAMVLQGLMANQNTIPYDYDNYDDHINCAIRHADELLKQIDQC